MQKLFGVTPMSSKLKIPKGTTLSSVSIGVAGGLNRKELMDLVYRSAIDLFVSRVKRYPNWNSTQVLYKHTAFEVTCDILEVPE